MSVLNIRDCTVGMRVRLSKQSKYSPHRNNPTIGSKHECGGIIVMSNGGHASVKWDNGTSNGYGDGDLISDTSPFCQDIWGEEWV